MVPEFDNWIPPQLPADDRMGYDIALYPIPGLKSPLKLADCDAEPNDSVDILCWQMLGSAPQMVTTQGLVIKERDEAGYLRLATVTHITHGCSGCPIFDNEGRVYGMVTMGRTNVEGKGMSPLLRHMEQNTCWAFKTSYIKRFMP